MLLPDWLGGPFANFDGRVWSVGCIHPPQPVPLFIANRPVLVPIRAQSPLSTAFQPEMLPDPLPQLSLRADVWLPDNHVKFAFSQFPGCLGFMIFFDRTLLVIFPKGYKCLEALNQLPEEFGGLMVGLAEEAGRFSLADTGQQPEGRKITVPAAAPPIVRPGESIYIHGPLYGADPPPNIKSEDLDRIAPLYDSQKASIGLLLDLGEDSEGHMLSTVTHLVGENLRAVDRAVRYIRERGIAIDGLDEALGSMVLAPRPLNTSYTYIYLHFTGRRL